jgi:hypothetical protein
VLDRAFPPLRRRSRLVDRSCESPARENGSALLKLICRFAVRATSNATSRRQADSGLLPSTPGKQLIAQRRHQACFRKWGPVWPCGGIRLSCWRGRA